MTGLGVPLKETAFTNTEPIRALPEGLAVAVAVGALPAGGVGAAGLAASADELLVSLLLISVTAEVIASSWPWKLAPSATVMPA